MDTVELLGKQTLVSDVSCFASTIGDIMYAKLLTLPLGAVQETLTTTLTYSIMSSYV